MPTTTASSPLDRDAVIGLIRRMPKTATVDEIIDQLQVAAHIEEGLAQLDAGQVLTTKQVLESLRA